MKRMLSTRKPILKKNKDHLNSKELALVQRTAVPVVNSLPPGWKLAPKGALTAPLGHIWIYNGKGLFDEDLQLALLRLK